MASLIEQRLHFGRHAGFNIDHQPNPIGEGTPLDEFRNGAVKASGINELTFGFGLVT